MSWFDQLDLKSLQEQLKKSVEKASNLDILNLDAMAEQEEEEEEGDGEDDEEEEGDDDGDEEEEAEHADKDLKSPIFVDSNPQISVKYGTGKLVTRLASSQDRGHDEAQSQNQEFANGLDISAIEWPSPDKQQDCKSTFDANVRISNTGDDNTVVTSGASCTVTSSVKPGTGLDDSQFAYDNGESWDLDISLNTTFAADESGAVSTGMTPPSRDVPAITGETTSVTGSISAATTHTRPSNATTTVAAAAKVPDSDDSQTKGGGGSEWRIETSASSSTNPAKPRTRAAGDEFDEATPRQADTLSTSIAPSHFHIANTTTSTHSDGLAEAGAKPDIDEKVVKNTTTQLRHGITADKKMISAKSLKQVGAEVVEEEGVLPVGEKKPKRAKQKPKVPKVKAKKTLDFFGMSSSKSSEVKKKSKKKGDFDAAAAEDAEEEMEEEFSNLPNDVCSSSTVAGKANNKKRGKGRKGDSDKPKTIKQEFYGPMGLFGGEPYAVFDDTPTAVQQQEGVHVDPIKTTGGHTGGHGGGTGGDYYNAFKAALGSVSTGEDGGGVSSSSSSGGGGGGGGTGLQHHRLPPGWFSTSSANAPSASSYFDSVKDEIDLEDDPILKQVELNRQKHPGSIRGEGSTAAQYGSKAMELISTFIASTTKSDTATVSLGWSGDSSSVGASGTAGVSHSNGGDGGCDGVINSSDSIARSGVVSWFGARFGYPERLHQNADLERQSSGGGDGGSGSCGDNAEGRGTGILDIPAIQWPATYNASSVAYLVIQLAAIAGSLLYKLTWLTARLVYSAGVTTIGCYRTVSGGNRPESNTGGEGGRGGWASDGTGGGLFGRSGQETLDAILGSSQSQAQNLRSGFYHYANMAWEQMNSTNGISLLTAVLFVYSYYKFGRYGTDTGD